MGEFSQVSEVAFNLCEEGATTLVPQERGHYLGGQSKSFEEE